MRVVSSGWSARALERARRHEHAGTQLWSTLSASRPSVGIPPAPTRRGRDIRRSGGGGNSAGPSVVWLRRRRFRVCRFPFRREQIPVPAPLRNLVSNGCALRARHEACQRANGASLQVSDTTRINWKAGLDDVMSSVVVAYFRVFGCGCFAPRFAFLSRTASLLRDVLSVHSCVRAGLAFWRYLHSQRSAIAVLDLVNVHMYLIFRRKFERASGRRAVIPTFFSPTRLPSQWRVRERATPAAGALARMQ